MVAEGLAGPGAEQAMEVEGREVRYRRERLQIERLIEMALDVIHHAVNAPLVLDPAVERRGGTLRTRAHRSCAHGKRRRLTALNSRSLASPIRPMTMIPKMIWSVASSAWLSVIMWPMPLEAPISSATIT